MKDPCPPTWQRRELERFQTQLDVARIYQRRTVLNRDGCGDWALFGKFGHVFATPEGFQLVIRGRSGQHWTHIKKRLGFLRLTQDGDEEGVAFFETRDRKRAPAHAEAEIIRSVIGLPRFRHQDPETIAAATKRLQSMRQSGASMPGNGSSDPRVSREA